MSYGPGRSNRGAGNPGSQPVMFTLHDAERIGRAVGQVETGRRRRIGSSLPRAVGSGGGEGEVQFATCVGGWQKGQYKVVTMKIDDSTASAYNSMSHIAGGSSPRECVVAKYSGEGPSGETGEYRLISAECF